MSVELEKFWILDKSGATILEVEVDPSKKYSMSNHPIDPKVFGEFKFLLEQGRFNRKSFHTYNAGWGKFSCIVFYHNNLLLIYQSSQLVKDKNIQKFCEMVVKLFEEMCPYEEIEKWTADLSYFDKLQRKLIVYSKMSNL